MGNIIHRSQVEELDNLLHAILVPQNVSLGYVVDEAQIAKLLQEKDPIKSWTIIKIWTCRKLRSMTSI